MGTWPVVAHNHVHKKVVVWEADREVEWVVPIDSLVDRDSTGVPGEFVIVYRVDR